MSITFTWNGEEVRAELERRAQALVREAAAFMLARYLVYAPVDTGRLAAAAEVIEEDGGNLIVASVVDTAPYAFFVEMGHLSTAGTWVAPRPALRMAIADTAAAFPEIADRIRTRGFGTGS